MVGQTCLEGWYDSTLTISFPSSSSLTSWGISKHLTINLQHSGILPLPHPGSFLLSPFLFHSPRKPEQPEGLTHLSSLSPSPKPRHHLLFSVSGLPHFPSPNCLLPQIFWFPGQLGPGCGGQKNPVWQAVWPWPFLLPFSELGRPPYAWIWSTPPLLMWELQIPLQTLGCPWDLGGPRFIFSGWSDGSPQTQRGGSRWAQPGRSNLPG